MEITKDIRDYLHFYMKQWVVISNLSDKMLDETDYEEASYGLTGELYHWIMMGDCNASIELRSLTSLTLEEVQEINIEMGQVLLAQIPKDGGLKFFNAIQFDMMLKKGFDLFGLIRRGIAIEKKS